MNNFSEDKKLCYIGLIILIEEIEGCDNICLAYVDCKEGGTWRGIVQKKDIALHDSAIVFLPDSLLNQVDIPEVAFMEKHNWRVRLKRFKGVPSEVLIIPNKKFDSSLIGTDITFEMNVKKYMKSIPAKLQGAVSACFPGFIPKTNETNYQACRDLIEKLEGEPYYVTEKYDGTSCTVYNYNNHFGVCSRNHEIERDEENAYWKIALKYRLDVLLPKGIALQMEICGPKIQENHLNLKEIEAFVFSGYDIYNQRYMEYSELETYCKVLNLKMVKFIDKGNAFIWELWKWYLRKLMTPLTEGFVIRSQNNILDGYKPISFKILNLDYKYN